MPDTHQRISPTAMLVLYFRAFFTDMPFARAMYDAVRQIQEPSRLERIAPFLIRLAKQFPKSLARLSSLEARYLATNAAIAGVGVDTTIIEVAAGMSPRGLAWAREKRKFIETDLPEILGVKQEVFGTVAQAAGIPRNPHHFFVPLQALAYAEWEAIGEKFFAGRQEKVVIIHEGLVAYFTPEEQRIFRDNIAKFLRTYAPRGMWVTPDFNLPKRAKDGWLVQFSKLLIKGMTHRSFHYFRSPEEVESFLHEAGLRGELLENSAVLDRMTCISKLHVDRKEVGAILERFRAYAITLQSLP